jgi:hypothetical protein
MIVMTSQLILSAGMYVVIAGLDKSKVKGE